MSPNCIPLLFSVLLLAYSHASSQCPRPPIVHMDFCDFLSSPPGEGPDSAALTTIREKDLHYLVYSRDPTCMRDTLFEHFIRNNPFIQKEIHGGYTTLSVTFYKESAMTDSLMSRRIVKFLDDCWDDIFIKYDWTEGKLTSKNHFIHGAIKGSENIQLHRGSH